MNKNRVVYSYAEDVERLARDIVEILKDFFWYIDISRVYFIRSKNSRTQAIARIHGLPRIWLYVLKSRPGYVVEVVSERFDSLNLNDKIYVLIHELLHIPKSFSGALRPHRSFVSSSEVRKLTKIYLDRKHPQQTVKRRAGALEHEHRTVE